MRILLAVVGVCACAHGRAAPDPELANWRSQHPVAARQLCSFALDASETSRMRRWMHDHPTQAADLLDWAAAHRGSSTPPPFLLQTPPEFDGYRPARDPAVYALFDWASQNPDAAQDLASTHSGVAGAIDGRNC